MGWYSGDATELATPQFERKAQLYVSAMGGRDNVLSIGRLAIDNQDYGWAMEVLTHVVRADPGDLEARDMKAEAMRAWGYEQANIYYRNFALSGAAELDGTLNRSGAFDFASPVIIEQFSVGTILENLRVKIDAEQAIDADFRIGFNITDRGESYGFHVRNGIAAFYESIPENADLVLNIPSQLVYDFVLQRRTVRAAIEDGDGTADGDPDDLDTFAAYLDLTQGEIELASR